MYLLLLMSIFLFQRGDYLAPLSLCTLEKDGSTCLMPVAVYPKKYLNELKEEINGVKARLASGEQPVFDSVDALFDKLEAD